MFLLIQRDNLSFMVKDDKPIAGGSLVQREHVRHRRYRFPSRTWCVMSTKACDAWLQVQKGNSPRAA